VPEVPAVPGLEDKVDAVFAADGPLARTIPDFEPRSGQLDMAGAVARAFENGGVLLAEAGTGTGKTLAYLVAAILSAYGIDIARADQAPFLNKVSYFNKPTVKSVTAGARQVVGSQQALELGGLGATQVADALGSLIAERFKQEAEMEALHRFGALILQSDCPRGAPVPNDFHDGPLSKGFPSSVRYLRTLAVDPANVPCNHIQLRPVAVSDWAVLQSSFKVDVAALPDNLPVFLDALYGDSDKTDARYLTWLAATGGGQIYKRGRLPYQLIDALVRGSVEFRTAKGVPDSSGNPRLVGNVDTGLAMLAILSHMLTVDARSEWRTTADVKQFVQIESCTTAACDNVYLWLGLSYAVDHELYDKVDKWLSGPGGWARTLRALGDEPAATKADIDAITNAIAEVQSLAAVLERLQQHVHDIPLNDITSIANAAPLVSDLGSAAASVSRIVEGFATGKPVPATDPLSCAGDPYCEARQRLMGLTTELQYGFNLIGDIRTKQYAAAVGELIVYVGTYVETLHGGPCASQEQSERESSACAHLAKFLSDNGPFIAAVASAQSADDLKVALDNYALPAGSYTQQQQNDPGFTVTLNGFFGVGVGAETLVGNLEGTGVSKTGVRLGFAAPVGLNFNFGQVDRRKASSGKFFETGAWSVFVPVLDLGAVASYRLGGGGSVPAVTWENIVAPGLYVVWSKRDSPLSILLGAQYGPELRKVSANGNTIEKAAVQFPSLEVTFNIPIFNLYR